MGTIKAICTSDIKGIQKTGTDSVTLVADHGIADDAHAGPWHRQVSLLSFEKIEDFKKLGAEVQDGAFGENIIVEGFDLKALPIGTRFSCNDVVLELTQIGKECHEHCAIYHKMGDCIMPREGVFTRVIEGGTITVGDILDIVDAPEGDIL
ncbi:MAG: MOSC domain-containing protein [Coriobacteriaceae bacterium]|jgi:MOSC domain-containing protein YiiM|nr:MOSC domain-containing protein [Coriobacteriaceae bacterium]